MSDQQRLAIESIAYIGFGAYRSYRELEILLDSKTNQIGECADDPKFYRDSFTLAWSFLDSFHAIGRILRLKSIKYFVIINDEMRNHFLVCAKLRNYMDHISDNFDNVTKAKSWSPVFGTLSYQVNPIFSDHQLSDKIFFIVMILSTHLKNSAKYRAPDISSRDAMSRIDNIYLHIRKDDKFNLSRSFVELTLLLNNFSIDFQKELLSLAENGVINSGLRIPYGKMTISAKLEEPLIATEILTLLNSNKVRSTVTFNT